MNAGPVRTESAVVRRRRTAGFGAIAVAAVLVTAGCAAGRHAQTPNQNPTQDGVNATVGAMALRGLSIDAPTSNYYSPGSAAQVNLVLVNTGTNTDALTGITSSSVTGWGAYATQAAGQQVEAAASASAAGGGASDSGAPTAATTVAGGAGSRVSYGVPDATGSLLLTGTKGKIYPGTTVRLTFTFARAGTITVAVPIQLSTTPGQSTIPAPSGSDDNG